MLASATPTALSPSVVTRNTTLVRLRFFRHGDDRIPTEVRAYDSSYAPAGGRRSGLSPATGALVGGVISVTAQKALGGPSGSWVVEVKPLVWSPEFDGGQSWDEVILDGDYVGIDIVKNGEVEHVLAGRVDTVNVSIGVDGDGSPKTTIRIGGRDIGHGAEDAVIYFNPYDPLHSNVEGLGMVKALGEKFKITGSVDEIIPNLLVTLAGSGDVMYGSAALVPARVAGDNPVKWSDLVDIQRGVSAKLRGFLHVPNILSIGNGPSVWALAAQYANDVLNEMWLESEARPGGHYGGLLNLRERPFENLTDKDKSPWFTKLEEVVVDFATVSDVNVGRGKDRVNHVLVLGELPGAFGGDVMALTPPAVNLESIKRHGLRRYERTTPYFAFRVEDGTEPDLISWATEYSKWTRLVTEWNAMNHLYWQGVLTIREVRTDVKVGRKLVLTGGPPNGYPSWPQDGGDPKKAMTFYIEAVEQTWSDGETPVAATRVQITRGMAEDQRLPTLQKEMRGWVSAKDAEGWRSVDEMMQDPAGAAEFPDTGRVVA